MWLYLLAPLWSLLEVHVFGVAAVLGAGGAVVLVSALDLVATLVGDRSVCNGKSSTIELIVDQYLKYLAFDLPFKLLQ